VLTGDRYARDNKVTGDWWTDLESRRHAAIAACSAVITNFVSSDPEERSFTVTALKSLVAPSGRTTTSRPPIGLMAEAQRKRDEQ
jgi:hypothetical protein